MDKMMKLNKGAGCGASDLLVAAVISDPKNPIEGLNDSKKLSEKKRAELFPKIVGLAVNYELVRMTPQEVDTLNVFQARMEGFKRAIEILAKRTGADYAVIDGNKKPAETIIETDVLVKADAILPGVSCASIVAKHSHSLYINELCKDELYKKYGFEKHKGYGTKVHMEALQKYGLIEGFHRYSYQPVRIVLKNN
jgi:ribonuclease HII